MREHRNVAIVDGGFGQCEIACQQLSRMGRISEVWGVDVLSES
jgi:hypothetical protein